LTQIDHPRPSISKASSFDRTWETSLCFSDAQPPSLIGATRGVLVERPAPGTRQEDETELLAACYLRNVTEEAVLVVCAIFATEVHGSLHDYSKPHLVPLILRLDVRTPPMYFLDWLIN
jgi:hypothetical protein